LYAYCIPIGTAFHNCRGDAANPGQTANFGSLNHKSERHRRGGEVDPELARARLRLTLPAAARLDQCCGERHIANTFSGIALGRNDVINEGEAQQDKAEAQRNAAKKEAQAEKADAEAKVHEARERAEQK
jgi:hypothetical protein